MTTASDIPTSPHSPPPASETSEVPTFPRSSSPASEISEVPTSPDTNPPSTDSEAIYGRLNVLRTTLRRLVRTREALKRRIDDKLEAHKLMFTYRTFTLDYEVALTKHLNDFLEPLYSELEEVEVQLDEAEEEIPQLFHELAKLNRDCASYLDTEEEKVMVMARGQKRKREEGDEDGKDQRFRTTGLFK